MMRRLATGMLILAIAVTGPVACARFGASKFNPLNWFGQAQATGPAALYVPPEDGRLLVAQVTSLKIDKNPSGAIIRAVGLPSTQGWWQAELVRLDQDDDTKLVYEFRIFPPVVPAPAGTPASREVTVAISLSNVQLEGIRTITVQAEGNALTARR